MNTKTIRLMLCIALVLALGLPGCGVWNRTKVTPAEVTTEKTTERLDSRGVPTSRTKTSVKAKGPGLSTSSDKAAEKFNYTPPKATINNGAAGEAGSLQFSAKALSRGNMILYGVAALCIVSGVVVCIWLKMARLGIALCVAGVAVGAVAVVQDRYPWAMLLILLLGLAGAVFWILKVRKKDRLSRTLGAIVTGVEDTDHANGTKASIAKAAGPEGSPLRNIVRAEVRSAKKAAGLVK